MDIKKYRPVIEIVVLSILTFIIHQLILAYLLPGKEENFKYSLAQLYVFFSACSVAIILVLIKMKQKNIDSVGNTFMLLTCVKMVLAYVLLHPILNPTVYHKDLASEKTNFFIIFALFLTLETVVAIRLLNKK